MNVARMNKLADHLDTVPRHGFEMGVWITQYVSMKGDPLPTSTVIDPVAALKAAHKNDYKCGMAACVGGHACVVFPRLLKFEFGNVHHARHRYLIADDAIGKVLGLCENHANQLTRAGARHQTPRAAARFIRDLIRRDPPCCRGVR